MKRILTILAITIASVSVLVGQNDSLGMRQWKLTQLNGAAIAESSPAYVELDAAQKRFAGNGGCNRVFGSVDIQGRRIDFSNIGTTRMACTDALVSRAETAFVKALENVD